MADTEAVRARYVEGVVHLRGALTLGNANRAREAVADVVPAAAAVRGIDLAEVERVDSAALALLVSWRRDFGHDVPVHGASRALRSVAALGGLESWLFGGPAG